MKVLVCGSRYWTDRDFLYKALDKERQKWKAQGKTWKCLIEGDALGADKMAGDWAKSRGVQPIICPALWDFHGRPAGSIRNTIQAYLQPDIIIAFSTNLAESKGTSHMLSLVDDSKVTVYDGTEDLE